MTGAVDPFLSPIFLIVLLCSILFGFIVTLLTLHLNDCRVFDVQGSYIPGPISNLWGRGRTEVIMEVRKMKHGALSTGEVLLRELGDGNIVGFNTFTGKQAVIVAHPDMVKSVLSGHHLKLIKISELSRLKFFFGEGLLTEEGNKWQSHRQLIGPGFQSESLSPMISTYNKQAQRLVKYWTKNIRNLQSVQPNAKSIPVHLRNDVQQMTKTIMCYTCFGYDFQNKRNTNRDEVSAAFDAISEEINARCRDRYGEWGHWWELGRNGRTKSALACLHPLLDDIIATRLVEYTSHLGRKRARHSIRRSLNPNYNSNDATSNSSDAAENCVLGIPIHSTASLDYGGTISGEEHRLSEPASGDSSSHYFKRSAIGKLDNMLRIPATKSVVTKEKDLLDWLLRCGERADSAECKLSRSELRDHLCTFLSAGHETTSAALLWTIYELCRHPSIQHQCHAEVDTIMSASKQQQQKDCILHEDINKFDYLVQVLKESMRLHPVSGNIARRCQTECAVGDYKFKTGTTVIISTAALHKHPDFWEAPEEFRPERFSRTNIRCTVKHPYQYVPFGAGPRSCIGQRFALMEIIVVLGTLLSHFSFALAAKDSKSVQEEEGFTCHPKDLNVVVTLRCETL